MTDYLANQHTNTVRSYCAKQKTMLKINKTTPFMHQNEWFDQIKAKKRLLVVNISFLFFVCNKNKQFSQNSY